MERYTLNNFFLNIELEENNILELEDIMLQFEKQFNLLDKILQKKLKEKKQNEDNFQTKKEKGIEESLQRLHPTLKNPSATLTKMVITQTTDWNIFENFNYIKYIVELTFSRRNTFLHVWDSLGNSIYYHSAGRLQNPDLDEKEKPKNLLNSLLNFFTWLSFLKSRSVALHLHNKDSLFTFNKAWLIKILIKKLIIKDIKVFYHIPLNGCRRGKAPTKKRWTKKWVYKKIKKKFVTMTKYNPIFNFEDYNDKIW